MIKPYIESDVCPHCGSHNTDAEETLTSIDMRQKKVSLVMFCSNCGRYYRVDYNCTPIKKTKINFEEGKK